MTNGKLSAKTFIKDFTKKSQNIADLDLSKIDLNDSKLNDKTFDIENLTLDKSESNIQEYNELKIILETASACQISDAVRSVTDESGVIQGLNSINNQKAYGRIVTSKASSKDWGNSLLAIDTAKEGEILFLYTTGEPAAVWGELASTCAKEKGIVGAVIYGATRDIDVLLHLDFPVFALETLPNAGNPSGIGEINTDLRIGNYLISPGDFIFADESGVVVIQQSIFSDVILETLKIKIKEFKIIKQLKNGKSLSEIVGLK